MGYISSGVQICTDHFYYLLSRFDMCWWSFILCVGGGLFQCPLPFWLRPTVDTGKEIISICMMQMYSLISLNHILSFDYCEGVASNVLKTIRRKASWHVRRVIGSSFLFQDFGSERRNFTMHLAVPWKEATHGIMDPLWGYLGYSWMMKANSEFIPVIPTNHT